MLLKNWLMEKGNSYEFVSQIEKQRIINIVANNFKNGFRISSNIDFERLKNFYFEQYGKEFICSEESLIYVLSSKTMIYDDRAYFYSDEIKKAVRSYLEQLNFPCIYINYIFDKYTCELYDCNIFSIEMLRAFIEKNYFDISIKYDYILMRENVNPSDTIYNVFKECETWSVVDLEERLPYLKIDTIRQTLNGISYIRVDKSTYIHIDSMDLPSAEGHKIQLFVENKLKEKNFVIANELDLTKFEYLNPHCSYLSIRDAVFHKFLSYFYDKSGQIITRKGDKLRVLDILEQYCRNYEMISYDELNELESSFDPVGRGHSLCLIAGHNTMVRVSYELFVNDNKINFDIERIDNAISLYCHDNFLPIRKLTDFSLFPFIGYPWNLFLLESYLRRFSRLFKYEVRAVNSGNIGVIVRKSFEYDDYDEIMAFALASSSTRLNDKKNVENFLFDNGYIGRRILGKSEKKIIDKAKQIREGDKV